MCLQQRVHRAAVLTGRVFEMQQHADLIECHVQAATVPDEGQTLDVATVVHPVVAFRALCCRQQLHPLVVADGFCLRAGGLGQFANFHCSAFKNELAVERRTMHFCATT